MEPPVLPSCYRRGQTGELPSPLTLGRLQGTPNDPRPVHDFYELLEAYGFAATALARLPRKAGRIR